jgi:hypothetical protein
MMLGTQSFPTQAKGQPKIAVTFLACSAIVAFTAGKVPKTAVCPIWTLRKQSRYHRHRSGPSILVDLDATAPGPPCLPPHSLEMQRDV